MRTYILFFLCSTAYAFQVPVSGSRRPAAPFGLSMSTTEDVPVVVKGQNIELTPPIVDYVNKRIGGTLSKLSSNGAVRECDVILSVSKNPKVKNGHRVEVVTNVKGTSIICTNESPDMYNSIDSAAHALNRKLRKYKERRVAGWHGGANMGDDMLSALDALEEVELPELEEEEDNGFTDPEAPTITKVNSFDLDRAISVEEAVFALDYVDHDFYVFKNEDTDKVTVVYQRNVGGVGLIEP